MFLICPNCETKLQIDEAKTPTQRFKVRCPKCKTMVNVRPDGAERSSFEKPATAQPFKAADGAQSKTQTQVSGLNDVGKLLWDALRHADTDPGKGSAPGKRAAWDLRKALVCSSPAYREAIATSLAAHGYEVFVAENVAEALGKMREERMDVLILDGNFDPVEQGVAFVTREIKALRPSERRRMFLVSLTSGVRSMDLHAAFLQNSNLVINPSDLEQMPDILDLSIRHYNELYRDFNHALGATPI